MSIERREQQRFSLNLQARISYRHVEDQSPVIDTVAANISSGGAFLQTAHKFPMAAKVTVEFYLNFDDLKKLRFILSMESLKQLERQKYLGLRQRYRYPPGKRRSRHYFRYRLPAHSDEHPENLINNSCLPLQHSTLVKAERRPLLATFLF